MGLPFSKIIQNGQEYDVNASAPSSYVITSNTRLSNVQTLIENSVAKGFMPYIIDKDGNDIGSVMILKNLFKNDYAEFTCCRAGRYGSPSGLLEDAIIVDVLQIGSSAISYDGYGVNKSASAHNTQTISDLTLYYK